MRKNLALVLSGGGARGIAHIGVIEELVRQDIKITSIAGTSMGSLVGGVYALGKIEEFKNWICTLDKRRVFTLITKTLDLMTDHMAQLTLSKFSPDILINVSRDSCTMYDFYKAEEMIEIGRQSTLSCIGGYKDNKSI